MDVIKGKNVIIKDSVFIGDNVILEDDVYLDYGAIIRDNVHIKRGTTIGARCILGEYLGDFYEDRTNKTHPLVIGENSIIRSETIIYGDCEIGDNFMTGHRVTIREGSIISENVRVGTLSDIQGKCIIGHHVNIHSNAHLGQDCKIGNYVWIYPYVVLTNDPYPPSEILTGVTIEDYAVVAVGAVVLPDVTIGEGALVAAGTIVTKNVERGKVVSGNPGREKGNTFDIINRYTNEPAYPWRDRFDRGMPWEGSEKL